MLIMAAQHIALVFHDFSTGGSERIAIRLANAWYAAGRRVTIFCGTQEGRARSLLDPGIEVIACDPPIRRGWGSRIRLGWRLSALLSAHRPDIVFAPGNFHLIVLALAARRSPLRRPPFVCKISNPIIAPGSPSLLRKGASAILRRALAPIDQLTAMSPLLAHEAESLLAGRALKCIDEPVLDQPAAPSIRRKSRYNEPIILCAGRLERQKDFPLALRAFAELSPLCGARLVILGEGPERSALLALARQLGIAARVDMPGHVGNVSDWMRRARLFLLTSHFEGFPAVLIEARAAGLPVVAADCSIALSEILTSPCHGEIVRSRRAGDIAGAIRRQLDAGSPDAIEVARGTERFEIRTIAPQWLKLFDQTVDQQPDA